jgi:cytochrome c biogenesis protein CcmG/thiol:disulfide interchange protein DsbE
MSEAPVQPAASSAPQRRLLAFLPLIVVAILAALFFARLFAGDASKIPSALIGHTAPPLDLTGLDGGPGLSDKDLRAGHVSVVNVFATWCLPCHAEHETLLALAGDKDLAAKGVVLYGVAQKDKTENVRRFLGAKGDPYAKIGLDPDNRAGIDWGVYGVPETFIVRGDGTIAYKLTGPMDAQILASVIKPQIEKAMN